MKYIIFYFIRYFKQKYKEYNKITTFPKMKSTKIQEQNGSNYIQAKILGFNRLNSKVKVWKLI